MSPVANGTSVRPPASPAQVLLAVACAVAVGTFAASACVPAPRDPVVGRVVWETEVLRAPTDGRVVKIDMHTGSDVAAGETVCTLATSPAVDEASQQMLAALVTAARQRLSQRTAEVATARDQQLQDLQAEILRVTALLAKLDGSEHSQANNTGPSPFGFVSTQTSREEAPSPADLRERLTELQNRRLRVAEAVARDPQIRRLRLELARAETVHQQETGESSEFAVIVSTQDATVVQLPVQVGQTVRAGDAIAILGRPANATVQLRVPEHREDVWPLGGLVWLQFADGQVGEGRVTASDAAPKICRAKSQRVMTLVTIAPHGTTAWPRVPHQQCVEVTPRRARSARE